MRPQESHTFWLKIVAGTQTPIPETSMGWNQAFSLLARCNEATVGGQISTLQLISMEV